MQRSLFARHSFTHFPLQVPGSSFYPRFLSNKKTQKPGYTFGYKPKPFFSENTYYGETRNQKLNDFLIGLGVGGILIYSVFKATDFYLHPETKEMKEQEKQQIVVLGSGWGGMSFVKDIDTNKYNVTIISPRNYLLFTPLLSEMAFGMADASEITETIRSFISRTNPEVKYLDATCNNIDPVKKVVSYKSPEGKEFVLKYDKLVIAVGGVPNTYNIKGVNDHCMFLKNVEDARKLKNRVVENFEKAVLPGKSDREISKLLHFVVVGDVASPSAILASIQLAELLKEMRKLYPTVGEKAKITYLKLKTSHEKNIYDAKIAAYYKKNYAKNLEHMRGTAKVTETDIVAVENDKLILGKNVSIANSKNSKEKEEKREIEFGACLWIPSTSSNPLVAQFQTKSPKLQRNKNALLTNEFLKVRGFDDIYALGECATVDQGKLMHKWMDIFKSLDENEDGFIDPTEFENLVGTYSRRYPQLLQYATNAKQLFDEADTNRDGKLSIEEFKAILEKVDSTMTSLPSSAQSAVQQGSYLATSLNKILREKDIRKLFKELDEDKSGSLDALEIKKGLKKLGLPFSKNAVEEFISSSDKDKDGRINEQEFLEFVFEQQQQGGTGDWKKLSHSKILPFRYQHLGGFEYVGYNSAHGITERGSQGNSILDGFGAWWLWRSIFTSNLISMDMKFRILFKSMLAYFNMSKRDLSQI